MMKKMYQIPAFMLSTVLTASAVIGNTTVTALANDNELKTLRINIAATEEQKADYEEAIARFEEKHPDFKVEANYTGGATWKELCDKMIIQIASGEAPDICNVAVEGARMFIGNDLFIPLNDLLENDEEGQELLEQIPQSAWDSFSVDGNIYEIPNDSNSIILQYNSKMYQDAGLEAPADDYNWEQFVSDLQVLTKGDGDDKVYGTMIMPSFLWPWFYANGVSPVNDDWTASNLSDPKVKEVLQNLYDLIYVYGVAPVPETNDDVINMFAAGRTATICMGPFAVASYEASGFTDFDASIMPRMSEDGFGCFGIGGMGVTASCKYPEAAYDLCKEFAAKEVSERQAQTCTSLPLREEQALSETFLNHAPNMIRFYDELRYGVCLPAPENYSEFSEIMTSLGFNILTDAMSIDDAIAQADQELTDSFNNLY